MKFVFGVMVLITVISGCREDAPSATNYPEPQKVSQEYPDQEPIAKKAALVDTKPRRPVSDQEPVRVKNQVYKCKTSNGTTFSDVPCAGNTSEIVDVRPASVIDNSGLREKAANWQEQDAYKDSGGSQNKPKAVLIGDNSSGGIESTKERNKRVGNAIDCRNMSARACEDLKLRKRNLDEGHPDPGSSKLGDAQPPPQAAPPAVPAPPQFITDCNQGGCFTNTGNFIPK